MDGDCISMNIFDEEIIYEDCSVQILRNSQTKEESVGWWRNEGWHKLVENDAIPNIPLIAYSKENNQQMIGMIYWDNDCDCYICDYEGILMFDVMYWRYLPTPPEDEQQ